MAVDAAFWAGKKVLVTGHTGPVLDSSRARARLGWEAVWDAGGAVAASVDWHLAHRAGEDVRATTLAQIERHRARRVPA